jgi:hypothetical protein
MTKPIPARYHSADWSAYNGALMQHGSLLIWLDREMTRHAPQDGLPHRPGM